MCARALVLAVVFALAGWLLSGAALAGDRKALVIGISEYGNGLAKLPQAKNDAEDVAALLASKGFEFAVTRLGAAELKDRQTFDKAFETFLGSVGEKDEVLVYVSGHGFGDPDPKKGNHYLLMNAQSRDHFIAQAKKSQDYEGRAKSTGKSIETLAREDYAGKLTGMAIPENDIVDRLRAKKTSIVLFIADACRSYLPTKDVGQDASSSANLHLPERTIGVFRLYSAQPGKVSLESDDGARVSARAHSVFTGALLIHISRPDPVPAIAYRVRAHVAQATKEVQVPTWSEDSYDLYQLYRGTGPVSERSSCEDFGVAYQQLQSRRQRNALTTADVDIAIAEYGRCGQEKLDALGALRDSRRQEYVLDQTLLVPQVDATIDKCDAEAASPVDPARPQRVRGVDVFGRALAARFAPQEQRKAVRDGLAQAIGLCEVAIKNAPRNARFRFNLARVHHAASVLAATPEQRRTHLFEATRLNLEAVNEGYASAFNNLAFLYDTGEVVLDVNGTLQQLPRDQRLAFSYYSQGADRGHLVARYNLALKLRNGETGEIDRSAGADLSRAYRLFAQAADAGYIPAMIEAGLALRYGRGIDMDPKRALAMFETAARRGSGEAMYQIGSLYLGGQTKAVYSKDGKVTGREQVFPKDESEALIWMLRAAETGHVSAIENVADMLRAGEGIPVRQADAAARYMRLAANAGSPGAQAALAEMLQRGEVQRRPNEPVDEFVRLLKLAQESGHASAALTLAKLYGEGLTIGTRQVLEADRDEAVRLAQRAYLITNNAPMGDPWSKPSYLYEAASLLIKLDSQGAPIVTAPPISELREIYGGPNAKPSYMYLGSALKSCSKREFVLWPSKVSSPLAAQVEWYEKVQGCLFWKKKCDYLRDVFETAKSNKDGDMGPLIDFDKMNKIDADEEEKEQRLARNSSKPDPDRFNCTLRKSK